MSEEILSKEDKIKKVKEILKQHNIEMSVWGCGCCSSPYFYMEYKGEVIADDDEFCFSMGEEEA